MSIGRVAGPMLLTTQDRQGVDLNFITDPGTGAQTLFYMDFSGFKLGVNTSTLTERLTVDGNIAVNSTITSFVPEQHIYITTSGAGQTVVSNIDVLAGRVNDTTIGLTTPSSAFFTTANSTGKSTLNTLQVQNLTPGRIPFTDGTGLTDDPDMLFFTGNNTFYATNIESAGTVGYANLVITGEFLYGTGGDEAKIPYFKANGLMVDSPTLKYFEGNNIFSTTSVQILGTRTNQVVYTNTANVLTGSTFLTYDGFTLNSGGTTILGSLSISGRTIISTGVNQDIFIVPDGAGSVSLQEHRIIDVATPINDGDAATKGYVLSVVNEIAGSPNSINEAATSIIVRDTGLGTANAVVIVEGLEVARFEQIYSYINDIKINDAVIATAAGPLTLQPFNNDRVQIFTSSAVTLPVASTAQRPIIPRPGDFRYNTDIATIEWYNGFEWVTASGNVTIATQTITPNGVDSVYTITQTATTESVLVNINGTIQQPSAAYSVVGDQITFVEVPLISDIIEIRFLSARPTFAANPIFVSTQFSNVLTSGTTVDTFYVSQYRSASYEFTAKNTTSSTFQIGEIYLIHNTITSNVQASLKSTMGSATPLITWTSTVDPFGAVRLIGTAASTNTVVKLHRTYFNDL